MIFKTSVASGEASSRSCQVSIRAGGCVVRQGGARPLAAALLRSASVALLIRHKPKTLLHIAFLDQHMSEAAGWARQACLCIATPAIDRLASDVEGSGLGAHRARHTRNTPQCCGASVQRRSASVEARAETQRVTGSFQLSRNLHEPASALRQESAPILASRKFLKPSDPRKDAKPSRISD
ncbi:hypothetical protein PaG_05028 [Moesziomyces aphidis]|uniref:Uncharacterized protein n=1 Tax=Moesziomyces aphidis TaxID=84754 RepID=W3VHS4_MOEAP|nr:hypothetical protein PaG_05028 [Moesziomyces aphidis]